MVVSPSLIALKLSPSGYTNDEGEYVWSEVQSRFKPPEIRHK